MNGWIRLNNIQTCTLCSHRPRTLVSLLCVHIHTKSQIRKTTINLLAQKTARKLEFPTKWHKWKRKTTNIINIHHVQKMRMQRHTERGREGVKKRRAEFKLNILETDLKMNLWIFVNASAHTQWTTPNESVQHAGQPNLICIFISQFQKRHTIGPTESETMNRHSAIVWRR